LNVEVLPFQGFFKEKDIGLVVFNDEDGVRTSTPRRLHASANLGSVPQGDFKDCLVAYIRMRDEALHRRSWDVARNTAKACPTAAKKPKPREHFLKLVLNMS
jgi:hypothetical protein